MKQYDIVVDKVVYRNKDTNYTVFKGVVLSWMPRKKEYRRTKETHTFVGFFFCIFDGDQFSVEGEEAFHPTYGSQIVVKSNTRKEPVTELEIRTFLRKSIKGMTPNLVNKVMDKFGLDAITALRKDAHAYDFLGISQDSLDEIRSTLMQNICFENILLFLQMHNIDCRYAQTLFKKYGDTTVRILSDSPYVPYADNIFDFKVADKLYLDLGNKPDSSQRCKYATLAAIQMDSANNGNVFLPKNNVSLKMRKYLADTSKSSTEDGFPFTEAAIENAIIQLENGGFLIQENHSGRDCVYLKSNYYDERQIANCLKGLMTQPKRIPYTEFEIEQFLVSYQQSNHITLADEQSDAVRKALTSSISIISGGPGTGKTLTIKAIMSAIKALSPDAVIRACAPTGKAAIRISEVTGSGASTIHRMLKIGHFQEEIHGGELVCDFMFIDEFSMVDIQLCAKLFDAVNSCGRIVIVGDYNQLPSVGPGLVLRDMIASKAIPATFLKHVFRQAGQSLIAVNANRIIHPTPTQGPILQTSQSPGGDFYFLKEDDPRRILKTVFASLKKAQKDYGYSLKDIQILSPIRHGDIGVDNLNFLLQQAINPNPVKATVDDKELRVGDKVIHTKNNYELEVFNGEVGFIREITFKKDNYLCVEYPDRDVWYPLSAIDELDLAYALTVHKLQGSEYPVIIMPVHELQGVSLSKNLIYTALTRAKKLVILIGSNEALTTGLHRETTIERESNLVDRILSIASKI